jgi:hypothetical protein
MGGSVIGGDFYGVAGSNGTVFPTLAPNGPDDTDKEAARAVDGFRLRLWISMVRRSPIGSASRPVTSPSFFPNLGRFNQPRLSFL